jgi:hypothetical protein
LAAQTDEDFLWFFFPLFFWGIGLALHYVGVTRWGARDIRRRQEKIERQAATHRPSASYWRDAGVPSPLEAPHPVMGLFSTKRCDRATP